MKLVRGVTLREVLKKLATDDAETTAKSRTTVLPP